MKPRILLFLLLSALLPTTALVAQPWQPNWDSIDKRPTPAWFSDAKFGIFIHWGVYSVAGFGSEWYSRNMYQQGTPDFAAALACPPVKLHLYGKLAPRPGRKMGHLTALAPDPETAIQRAADLAEILEQELRSLH